MKNLLLKIHDKLFWYGFYHNRKWVYHICRFIMRYLRKRYRKEQNDIKN